MVEARSAPSGMEARAAETWAGSYLEKMAAVAWHERAGLCGRARRVAAEGLVVASAEVRALREAPEWATRISAGTQLVAGIAAV